MISKTFIPTVILGLALSSTAFAAPPTKTATVAAAGKPAGPSPGPWLHETVERAKKLAERKVAPGTPAETTWQKEVKDAIDDVVDWPEMTQKALGKGWEERTPKEREEFSKLLRTMVEASYQSKLKLVTTDQGKTANKVTLTWDKEVMTGNTGTARATVKEGKASYTLDFALKHDGKRWRVWDVSIDEVSTVRTYRTSFTKIIADKGFPALIDRMKKKVDEVKNGKGVITP